MAIFSTAGAAAVAKVSQQKIIALTDSGSLPSFRVPLSRFRRVPSDGLREWMDGNGIGCDRLDRVLPGIVVVSSDADFVHRLGRALSKGDCTFLPEQSLFGVGASIVLNNVKLVAVDLRDVNGEDVASLRRLKTQAAQDGARVIALHSDGEAFQSSPLSRYFAEGIAADRLLGRVQEVIDEQPKVLEGPSVSQILEL